jgi:hypothetical protein
LAVRFAKVLQKGNLPERVVKKEILATILQEMCRPPESNMDLFQRDLISASQIKPYTQEEGSQQKDFSQFHEEYEEEAVNIP